MNSTFSLLNGIFDAVADFFTGILALIPQFLYFIYTCLASLLDFMQLVVRKVVGLDVYYVDGVATSGDIVSDFIYGVLGIQNSARYSALTTVFWSLVIFGCILLVLTTIFAIIKAHYNYDAEKSRPGTIIMNSIKTFFLMAIIPLCCIFGVYLSNILLVALDGATSYSSTEQIKEVYKNSNGNYAEIFEKGTTVTGLETYASYDFFTYKSYTNTTSFSGILFKISCKDANRVRHNSYTASNTSTDGSKSFKWTDFGIFTSQVESKEDQKEDVANMIDYAFANNLTLNDKTKNASVKGSESCELKSQYVYLESAIWALGLRNVKSFSKYNVGLVWYYYNLWNFNFLVAYATMITCITIFATIFFGMVVRLIKLLALFLVFPVFVGVGPLNNNAGIGQWKSEFIKNVLMGYGAVAGLNITYLLLDEFQNIYFFQSEVLNNIVSIVLIIAILAVVKDIVSLISNLAGGEDAASVGGDTMQSAGKLAATGAATTFKFAKLAVKFGELVNPAMRGIKLAKQAAVKKIMKDKAEKEAKKKLEHMSKKSGKSEGEISKMKEDHDKSKELEDEEIKKAGDEHSKSESDTEDFERMIDDNENLEDDKEEEKTEDKKSEGEEKKEGEKTEGEKPEGEEKKEKAKEEKKRETKEEKAERIVKQFAERTGNDDEDSDTSAQNIYRRFQSAQKEEFAKIDADSSLSDEEKAEQKKEAHERLKQEAVEDFRLNNQHALAEQEHLAKAAEYNAQQEAYRQFEKENMAGYDPKKRSGDLDILADITGSTIKLVGNVTGVSSFLNSDNGQNLMNEFKSFGQTALSVDGFNGNPPPPSWIKTKEQKDEDEKRKTKEMTASREALKSSSDKMYHTVRDLCGEIERWLDRTQAGKTIGNDYNKDFMDKKRTTKVSKIKSEYDEDILKKIEELKRQGRILEAKELEKRRAIGLTALDNQINFASSIALEEKDKEGTRDERRARASARIDARIRGLRAGGHDEMANIIAKQKAGALNKIGYNAEEKAEIARRKAEEKQRIEERKTYVDDMANYASDVVNLMNNTDATLKERQQMAEDTLNANIERLEAAGDHEAAEILRNTMDDALRNLEPSEKERMDKVDEAIERSKKSIEDCKSELVDEEAIRKRAQDIVRNIYDTYCTEEQRKDCVSKIHDEITKLITRAIPNGDPTSEEYKLAEYLLQYRRIATSSAQDYQRGEQKGMLNSGAQRDRDVAVDFANSRREELEKDIKLSKSNISNSLFYQINDGNWKAVERKLEKGQKTPEGVVIDGAFISKDDMEMLKYEINKQSSKSNKPEVDMNQVKERMNRVTSYQQKQAEIKKSQEEGRAKTEAKREARKQQKENSGNANPADPKGPTGPNNPADPTNPNGGDK